MFQREDSTRAPRRPHGATASMRPSATSESSRASTNSFRLAILIGRSPGRRARFRANSVSSLAHAIRAPILSLGGRSRGGLNEPSSRLDFIGSRRLGDPIDDCARGLRDDWTPQPQVQLSGGSCGQSQTPWGARHPAGTIPGVLFRTEATASETRTDPVGRFNRPSRPACHVDSRSSDTNL